MLIPHVLHVDFQTSCLKTLACLFAFLEIELLFSMLDGALSLHFVSMEKITLPTQELFFFIVII